MPRVGQSLPKAWLTAAQAETVLALPKLENSRRPAPGLRDRAILETLYSTGLRRMEVAKLTAADVDFAGGVVLVRKGKGNKDRIVPIGDRALAWVSKYLAEARPKLAKPGNDAGPLFVTEQGTALTVRYVSAMVTRYVNRAALGKAGSCHLFRHTCATLMLEHGADIGPNGVLTGSARAAQGALEKAAALNSQQEAARCKRELERKRLALEKQISGLRSDYEIEALELRQVAAQVGNRTNMLRTEREASGILRQADTA
jgi:integrase/recombinase XerD